MPGYVYNTASTVTQRSGSYSGRGLLTTELLAGFVIVLIRVVADFQVQSDGSVSGKVLHPQGQYGPLPILAGLIGSFFFLSFVVMKGGTAAKLAVITGGAIVLTLAMKTVMDPEVAATLGTIGKVGSIVVPPASGTEETGAVVTPAPASSGSTNTGGAAATAPVVTPSTATTNAVGATGRALHQAESDLANFGSDFFTGNLKPTDFQQKFEAGLLTEPAKAIIDASNALRDGVTAGATAIFHHIFG